MSVVEWFDKLANILSSYRAPRYTYHKYKDKILKLDWSTIDYEFPDNPVTQSDNLVLSNPWILEISEWQELK